MWLPAFGFSETEFAFKFNFKFMYSPLKYDSNSVSLSAPIPNLYTLMVCVKSKCLIPRITLKVKKLKCRTGPKLTTRMNHKPVCLHFFQASSGREIV